MTVSLSSSAVLVTDMSSCSVRRLVEARPREEEARGCVNKIMQELIEKAVWGRMCRAPAELSIQSAPRWGQKRQEGVTPLGN